MLTKQNAGKYLSKEWNSDRIAALTDTSNFSSDELEYLEVSATTNGDEDRQKFMIDTNPADPDTLPRVDAIDIRKFPRNGGV